MDEQAETALDPIEAAAALIAGQDDESPDTDESAESQSEEDQGTEDAPDESEEEAEEADPSEEKPKPTSVTHKVTVKGEDGADVTLEVTEEELKEGYKRQRDYTQKTQALAEQSREAARVLEARRTEDRNFYLQQAQAAKSAILQVAGLKTEQELAELAHVNPTAWVQEQQRMRAVGGYLAKLDETIQQEQQKAADEAKTRFQETVSKAWEVLSEKGIDRPKLASMYETAAKAYGYKVEEIQQNVDPRTVLMLKDALAYRELQAKKPQVSAKVNAAEKLPAQKKSLPSSERKDVELQRKFKSGRADRNDLAAFIARNNL